MNTQLLRDIRIRKKKTQADMAKALGYSNKSAYCLIEIVVNKVTTDTASKIAAELHMTRDEKIAVFLDEA